MRPPPPPVLPLDSCLGMEVGLALREETLEWRPPLERCCWGVIAALSVTGWSAEEEEFLSRFPGLEEKGLSVGALPPWGLETEVMIAGLLLLVQPLRIPAMAKLRVAEVGVVGNSLRLDSERWLRLGSGGEGEGGV